MVKKNVIGNSPNVEWKAILCVLILSYGFLLANPSIGIDDENFDFYFKYNGLVSSGRWGSWFIKILCDSYEYLPVWRDALAIGILVVAAWMYIRVVHLEQIEMIDKLATTSGMCLLISYPIISKMFVYAANNIETAETFLLATLSWYFCEKYIISADVSNHIYRVKYLLASIFFMSLGCGLIESCAVYFCIELCISNVLRKETWGIKKISKALFILLVSIILSKIIGIGLTKLVEVPYSNYASASYMRWGSTQSVDRFLYDVYANMIYYIKSYFSVKLYVLSCLGWGLVSMFLLRKKKYLKAVSAVGIVVASIAILIITGNGTIPLRVFTTNAIVICSLCLYLYDKFKKKRNFKVIFVVIVIFCVFYQTKETNEYYQKDYKRYMMDKELAENINYDLIKLNGGEPTIPVVFIGGISQYDNIVTEGEWSLQSIFSN